MIKAIFSDFYGTIVREDGPNSMEAVRKMGLSVPNENPREVFAFWNRSFRGRQKESYGDTFQTQYEITLGSFTDTLTHYGSEEDPQALWELMVKHWNNPPLFEDGKDFFNTLPKVPVYFITNSELIYIENAIRKHGLQPAGIIAGEHVRSYKPRPEIFQYALDQNGLKPEEVLHIGDSLEGDYYGAMALGIQAVWLNRSHSPVPENVLTAYDLADASRILTALYEERAAAS